MDKDVFELIVATIAVFGWASLLVPLLIGLGIEFLDGVIDAAIDSVDFDLGFMGLDDTRALGLVICLFLTIFGSITWVMSAVYGANQGEAVVAGIALALTLAYLVRKLVLWLLGEERTVPETEDRIGELVSLTTDLEPGEIGEAFLNGDKVAVKSDSQIPHKRGEWLIITGIDKHTFLVRSKPELQR